MKHKIDAVFAYGKTGMVIVWRKNRDHREYRPSERAFMGLVHALEKNGFVFEPMYSQVGWAARK